VLPSFRTRHETNGCQSPRLASPFLLSTAVWSPPPMPSLFSRSRTTSSPLKLPKPSTDPSDEFGRVASRGSARVPATVPAAKKERNVEKPRTRTLSAAKGRAPGLPLNEEEPVIPDGSFFPLNLDPPSADAASPSESERGPYYLTLSPSYQSFPKRRGIGTSSFFSPGVTTRVVILAIAHAICHVACRLCASVVASIARL